MSYDTYKMDADWKTTPHGPPPCVPGSNDADPATRGNPLPIAKIAFHPASSELSVP